MQNSIKNRLLSGWHFMRVLRLVFGVVFAIQAVIMKDYIIGLMSVFFLYQGITNTGCCGETCTRKYDGAKEKAKNEVVSFEEVK
ncbi:hypothetical protein CAP35_01425 [Chitinophagaceae bacterium IBVUCB1]|nr:hypothetical protein CAP35_01425 [Chitinophagaceae bacterium IBVUCB1]